MASSYLQIANLALSRIGQGQAIAAPDENSEPAAQIARVWDHTLDYVLDEFAWPFACRRVALALIEEAPSSDWAYAYRIPTDCLRALRLIPPVDVSAAYSAGSQFGSDPVNIQWSGRDPAFRIPFEVEGDDDGRVLYTDTSDAVLHYVARVTNASLFPSYFADLLAWKLAQEVADTIGRTEGRRDYAAAAYKRELTKATAKAMQDQERNPPPMSSLEAARY